MIERETAYYFIREKIKSNNIVCLKEEGVNRITKKPYQKILGVAYTEEGLRGIANKMGRYPYSGATNLKDAYRKPKLRWLKVEPFIPSEKPDKIEALHIDHAYRMCN